MKGGARTNGRKSLWPRSHKPYRPYGMSSKNVTGWNIRRIRIEKGLTVAQLSSALPTPSFLSCEELIQVELCNRKVYDHELWDISRALGVSVDDLYRAPPRKRRAKKEPQ